MSLVSLKQLCGGSELQEAVTDYQGHYEINGVKTYAYYADSSNKEVTLELNDSKYLYESINGDRMMAVKPQEKSYIDAFTKQIVDNENIPYKIYKNNNGQKGDIVATLTPYSSGSDKVVENGKNFSVDGKITHGYILSFGYIDDTSIYNNTIPFGPIGGSEYDNGNNDFSNYILECKDYAKQFIEAAVYKNIRKNKYINTKHKTDYGRSQEIYGNFNTVYGDTGSIIGGYNNVICGDGSSSICRPYMDNIITL